MALIPTCGWMGMDAEDVCKGVHKDAERYTLSQSVLHGFAQPYITYTLKCKPAKLTVSSNVLVQYFQQQELCWSKSTKSAHTAVEWCKTTCTMSTLVLPGPNLVLLYNCTLHTVPTIFLAETPKERKRSLWNSSRSIISRGLLLKCWIISSLCEKGHLGQSILS